MKITVYLASSMGNPIYRDSVEAFGDWMAQKGYDLVVSSDFLNCLLES